MIAHLRSPAITLAAIAAELGREAAARHSLYRKRVDAARMTQAEADRGLAIAAAWREDVERIAAAWGNAQEPAPPRHAISWRDRVQGLQRELELRRRFYPEWIDAGRMTAAEGAQQLACLEALLAIYHDGWDWRGPDGRLPGESPLAEQEWLAHAAAVNLARDPERQKEMTL